MRLFALTVGLALLAAGCISTPDDEAAPTPTPTATATPNDATSSVKEVHNATIDFAADPSGARQEKALEFPAGATKSWFTVEWESATPTTTTRGVRVAMFDADGTRVADCNLDTNAVTQAEGRGCGPQMNNLANAPYKLTWEGFGNVKAHVTIVAE